MAHLVIIEDSNGEVVNLAYFCSDEHAQEHDNYAGWYGCHEIHDTPQTCETCGQELGYFTSGGEWVTPEEQRRERLAERAQEIADYCAATGDPWKVDKAEQWATWKTS